MRTRGRFRPGRIYCSIRRSYQALGVPPKNESAPSDLEDEILAMYLDDSLDSETRAIIEQQLLDDSELLQRLCDMRTELEAVLEGAEPDQNEAALPEGRVLRMPKRQVFPRKIADLQSEGPEAAQG